VASKPSNRNSMSDNVCGIFGIDKPESRDFSHARHRFSLNPEVVRKYLGYDAGTATNLRRIDARAHRHETSDAAKVDWQQQAGGFEPTTSSLGICSSARKLCSGNGLQCVF